MPIAIIDYGSGNLRSVQKALENQGYDAVITSDINTVKDSSGIILPGVGAFDSAIKSLAKNGIAEILTAEIKKGKPFLGLCLGMQLLFDSSEEGKEKGQGLGILKGLVKKFNFKNEPARRPLSTVHCPLKIPHMGWNNIEIKKESLLFKDVSKIAQMYFVHSYYCAPEDESIILAETDYGGNFVSALSKDNIFALQFHPEKSSENGLKILNNFGRMCK